MLVKKLSNSELRLIEWIRLNSSDCIYYDGSGITITTEWLVGSLAGRGFHGECFSEAWNNLKKYLNNHINSYSLVGKTVRACHWPDYERVMLSLYKTKLD